jgi:hypothetical protein
VRYLPEQFARGWSVVLPVIFLWGPCGFHRLPRFLLVVFISIRSFFPACSRRAGDTSTHIVNDQDRETVNRLTPAGVWSRIPRARYRVIYPCADRD